VILKRINAFLERTGITGLYFGRRLWGYYAALAINEMARPIDAIKHQAKTVTVGTRSIT
jgi:hypothetical protein